MTPETEERIIEQLATITEQLKHTAPEEFFRKALDNHLLD